MPNRNRRTPLSHVLIFVIVSVLSDGQASQSIGDTLIRPVASPASVSDVGGLAEHALGSPVVICNGGQLSISTNNATLARVLADVQKCTGAKIEMSDSAATSTVYSQFGPGPVREVLIALLASAGYDYVLGSSSSDPDKVETVLLLARQVDAPTEALPANNAPVHTVTGANGGGASAFASDMPLSSIAEPAIAAKVVAAGTPIERSAARADRAPTRNLAPVPGDAARDGLANTNSTQPNIRASQIQTIKTIDQTRASAQVGLENVRWQDELAGFGVRVDTRDEMLFYNASSDNDSTADENATRYYADVSAPRYFFSHNRTLGPALVPAIDQYPIQISELATIRDENTRQAGYVHFDPIDSGSESYVASAAHTLRVRTDSRMGHFILWRELGESIWQTDRRLEIVAPAALTIIILLLLVTAGSLMKTWRILRAASFVAMAALWSLWFLHYEPVATVWVGIAALIGTYTVYAVFMLVRLELAHKRAKRLGRLQRANRTAQDCLITYPRQAEPKVHNVFNHQKCRFIANWLLRRRTLNDAISWDKVVGGSFH